ncbi:MAG TPA: GNAT family N-acetyltransferase [Crocinitomicaceae bacterium]|nr:GNAT family N-acetyltransferase [Crocinitomicaceae bacterium]
MTDAGQLWLKIKEDKIHLECIAVNPDERRKGNGRKLMGYLTELADETNTIVSLEVSTVGSKGMMMPHPVVELGSSKKNKIPVRSLPKWYGKFGFKKTEGYTEKKRTMLYTPKTK